MFKIRAARKNNNRPIQDNPNDIELKILREYADPWDGSDGSNEFDVFHDIHHYFQAKYNRDFNHHDFYFRAADFFLSLALHLEGKKNLTAFPFHTKQYKKHYEKLFHTELSHDSIIEYFNILLRKAQVTKGKEQLFYQRYVVRVALPILTVSVGVPSNTFTQIVEGIPQAMLYNERQMFVDTEDNFIDEHASLFRTLSQSSRPDAIIRFCQIAKRMPSGHRVSGVCSTSVEILENILHNKDLFKNNTSTYNSIFIVIMRKLLLSPRADREWAINIARTKLSSSVLITSLFFCPSFWTQLEERMESPSVIDTRQIFLLLQEAMLMKKRAFGPLHHHFNQSCFASNESNIYYAPCLDIRKLSAEACVIFFVLAYDFYKRYAVIRENLKYVLSECQKSVHDFDKNKIRLIKFLLKDSSQSRDSHLSVFCDNTQKMKLKKEDAALISQYISTKEKFYGVDRNLNSCLLVLQSDCSLTVNNGQRSQGFYNTPEGNGMALSAATSSSASSLVLLKKG